MDIIMFILLLVLVPVVVKDRVLPWWRNHRQQCCVSSGSHGSSADPPQSQQPLRRRRVRGRTRRGANGRRRNRRNRQSASSGSATAGAATATNSGGNSNTTSSKRMRWLPSWRPSWQQIAAGVVIVALLLGNIYQAVVISGLSDRIAALEEGVTASSEEDGSSYADGHPAVGDDAVQTASESSEPEAVEECVTEVRFDVQPNGRWGAPVEAKTHQEALGKLEHTLHERPDILAALRTRFGLADISFAVKEQVALATSYIENRDEWCQAADELMKHIRSKDVRLGLESGRYKTFFMDHSRGGVPWVYKNVRTSDPRKVLRVGDVDLQLICRFQPRSAAPAPTPEPAPAPTRQPAPTQPAPGHEHNHEPPSRQVRQEPPSEEEPPADNGEGEPPSEEPPAGDDDVKVRVCDTRNGKFVIVKVEHAREFDHFASESHPACQPDEDDDGDDADDEEVVDKPDQSHDCQHGNPGTTDCPEDETDERQDPDGSDHPDSEPEGSTEDPEGEQIEEPDEAPVVEDTTPGDEGEENPAPAPHPAQIPEDGADSGGDESGSAPEGSTDNDGGTTADQSDDTVEESDPPDNDPEEVPDDEGGSDADNPSDGIVDGPGTAETSTAGSG